MTEPYAFRYPDRYTPLKIVLPIIYGLMVIIGLVACYSLLNTGNPESLLRHIFPDPNQDFYVAVISSVIVFILGFFVFFFRDQAGFRELIQMNREKIREMRESGSSDAEIAVSILAAMGSTSGYKHNMARKKLIVYLSEFE